MDKSCCMLRMSDRDLHNLKSLDSGFVEVDYWNRVIK